MRNNFRTWLQCAALVVVAVALGGCPSSKRIVVEGYDDAALVRKRIMLLLPDSKDVKLTDAAAYGYARGTTAEGGRDQMNAELRTKLTYEISQHLDSNTVLNYADQSLSGSIMLNSTADFTGAQPKSWDAYKRAGREGNIDFFVVLNNVTFSNTASSTGGRGKEGIEADYSLLDLQQQKVVTSGHISLGQEELTTPADTYRRLAEALVGKLPFAVSEKKPK